VRHQSLGCRHASIGVALWSRDGDRKILDFGRYAALTGNFLIAVTKFAAAGWTGSSAILCEVEAPEDCNCNSA
jgi:hypothetical protein